MRREEFAADLAKRVQENNTWQIRPSLPRTRSLSASIGNCWRCWASRTHSPAPTSPTAAIETVMNCTEFPLTVEAPGEYSVAMVTRGGVALEGVNPKTMESTIVPGLFLRARCSTSTGTPGATT